MYPPPTIAKSELNNNFAMSSVVLMKLNFLIFTLFLTIFSFSFPNTNVTL